MNLFLSFLVSAILSLGCFSIAWWLLSLYARKRALPLLLSGLLMIAGGFVGGLSVISFNEGIFLGIIATVIVWLLWFFATHKSPLPPLNKRFWLIFIILGAVAFATATLAHFLHREQAEIIFFQDGRTQLYNLRDKALENVDTLTSAIDNSSTDPVLSGYVKDNNWAGVDSILSAVSTDKRLGLFLVVDENGVIRYCSPTGARAGQSIGNAMPWTSKIINLEGEGFAFDFDGNPIVYKAKRVSIEGMTFVFMTGFIYNQDFILNNLGNKNAITYGLGVADAKGVIYKFSKDATVNQILSTEDIAKYLQNHPGETGQLITVGGKRYSLIAVPIKTPDDSILRLVSVSYEK